MGWLIFPVGMDCGKLFWNFTKVFLYMKFFLLYNKVGYLYFSSL